MIEKRKFPIEINNLNWSFGSNTILDSINLKFQKGRLYSIIGPNGSGKTTLLRNISKSLLPEKECVYIKDKDIVEYGNKDFAKEIAYVPQHTGNEFDFSVMDIVLMGRNPYLKRFQAERKVDMDVANNAMKITNIWELRNKRFAEISGGESQRVIIARALTQQTDIVLLDEPISNLDILHQIEIMDIMKELVINTESTVITVLHDLNIAALYSDHIILISRGKIFMQGNPRDIITAKNIEEVYGIKVHIIPHPYTGRPQIVHLGKEIRNLEVAL